MQAVQQRYTRTNESFHEYKNKINVHGAKCLLQSTIIRNSSLPLVPLTMDPTRDENLVVLSGLPIAPQQTLQNLSRFLLRKLSQQRPYDLTKIYHPVDGSGQSLGYVQAKIACLEIVKLTW